jgi:hypothetical protein
MKNVFFYLGLGTLFTHELDAVSNHEWRVLPILRSLPEMSAMNAFVLLHIPIFAVVVALVASPDKRLRERSRLGVSVFLIVHAVLHLWYAGEATYEFSSALSRVLIFGGAVFGVLHIAASYRGIRQFQ